MDEKQDKQPVHFLHIGKTGGSAIKHAIKQTCAASPYTIRFHPHGVNLRDIPEGDKFVYILRDPITRFVSGFYSRQRQGKPRYNIPWRPGEKEAFETFSTPNQLAHALSSWNWYKRRKASQAMNRIQHINNSYWKWFESEQYFTSRQADIFFIAFQERLAEDFEILKEILECPDSAALPKDDIKAHRNPGNLDTALSEKAIANLHAWYKNDYGLIDLSRAIRKQMGY